MQLTKHAAQRIVQRSIPQFAIDMVLEWGAVEYHRGAEIYRIDKKGLRNARRYMGKTGDSVVEQLRRVYVVVSDGMVVTAARQTKHHKRERH